MNLINTEKEIKYICLVCICRTDNFISHSSKSFSINGNVIQLIQKHKSEINKGNIG